VQYSGPYHYKIFNINGNLIGQTAASNFISSTDTSFIYSPIDTKSLPRSYSIKLYYSFNNQDSLVGESSQASSIHVNTIPNDNQIELFWSENVPWVNDIYYIYKSSALNGSYTLIDSTLDGNYLDSNLINNTKYCYYVRSSGHYDDSTILSPLYNNSQRICDSPFDFTPPCPPKITIEGNCERIINTLTWTNPNNDCSDDVVSYNLYFTPIFDSAYNLLKTISTSSDTIHEHQHLFNNMPSVAGCYYVTAVDSVIYSNESIASDTVCFDNCPEYVLPNIFTPNQDGNNDYFQALLPINFIESIELEIFNRWGTKVFESSDPYFKWDGTNYLTNKKASSGVYYFHCNINTIRLSGIETIEFSSFIQLINQEVDNN
jgi:gliding motility-associated-like protein